MQQSIWKRFNRNRLAVTGLTFILLSAFLAIFAVVLSSDKTEQANNIKLQLAAREPGFTVRILKLSGPAQNEAFTLRNWFLGWPTNDNWIPVQSVSIRHLEKEIVLLEYTGEEEEGFETRIPYSAITGLPGLDSADVMCYLNKELLTEKTFWLGTDRFGRDMLSRMLLGARISLSVGFVAVFISLLIGTVLGCMAGYYGGTTDSIVMWLINVVWSMPTLLLVIALSMALGKGFWQIFIAVGLSMWVDVARIVRGQVVSLKEKEFVEAARVLGLGNLRIIFRHILPNISGPLTVIAAANFASAILLEAGLSFLGLGVQPPAPSWGIMIKEHFGYIVLDSAYLAIIPGIAIMLLVMSFNFVGNGLRDALDVKMK